MNLPIPSKTRLLFKRIGLLARERGEEAYAVGGFVRDLLLERPGLDIDIAIVGDGLGFARAFAAKAGSKIQAFTRFGTSIVVVRGYGKIDIATTRRESYEAPGALPRVEKADLIQDLYRRDFTLNAMALSLQPRSFLQLTDPFGGLEDLKRGRIRALHEGSFVDDPTRIFRAVRFEQRFGKPIEADTEKWLRAAVKGGYIGRVSGERLRNEFKLIFQEARPQKAILRLEGLGVLAKVHPSLGSSVAARRILPQVARSMRFFRKYGLGLDEEDMVWFQCLLGGVKPAQVRSLCTRLMFSRSESKIVHQSVSGRPSFLKLVEKDPLPSQWNAFLSPLKSEVRCFFLATLPGTAAKRMEKALVHLHRTTAWITGKHLQALGLEPGVRYSYILSEALNRQLDGKFKGRPEALEWVKKSFVSPG